MINLYLKNIKKPIDKETTANIPCFVYVEYTDERIWNFATDLRENQNFRETLTAHSAQYLLVRTTVVYSLVRKVPSRGVSSTK